MAETSDLVPVRRALISVSEKAGLLDFARTLHKEFGVQLLSTGGTAKFLRDNGLPVADVADVTGFPEMMDGRVKTLHPKIHGGILAQRDNPEHVAAMKQHGIEPIDLVCINLYPFEKTVRRAGVTFEEAVENIDIGGPSMVRSAAKNHRWVLVVTSPERYEKVLGDLREHKGSCCGKHRLKQAQRAFAHTAEYDSLIANYLATAAGIDSSGMVLNLHKALDLRYGENPHQRAALYRGDRPGLAHAEQLHGKQMSYNNYVDTDAAWRAAHDHEDPCVAIIKHANPCGIAVGTDIAAAHRKAHACDPVSAFGGVIAANREVDLAMAEQVAAVFTEVVVAPSFTADALEVLTAKRNIRLLRLPEAPPAAVELRPVSGGLLLQTVDRIGGDGDDPTTWTLATGEPLDAAGLDDLVFAWRSVRAVRSNAILLAHDKATVGVGMGQVNRVDAARLAVTRAGERAAGAVAASDAFFPFADGLQVLLDADVRAVVQPGGSVRDEEVVAAARAAGVPLYLTGTRHFAH